MSRIIIDESGRIQIPAELQAQCSLEPGMELEISIQEGCLRLEPLPDSTGKIVWKDGVPVFRADEPEVITIEMVNQAIEDVRLERDRIALGLEP